MVSKIGPSILANEIMLGGGVGNVGSGQSKMGLGEEWGDASAP
jgi:hypothetical protein